MCDPSCSFPPQHHTSRFSWGVLIFAYLGDSISEFHLHISVTLFRIFPTTASKSPFLERLMMWLSFHSVGISTSSQIFPKSSYSMPTVVCGSALIASSGILSVPAAFPDISFLKGYSSGQSHFSETNVRLAEKSEFATRSVQRCLEMCENKQKPSVSEDFRQKKFYQRCRKVPPVM